MTSASSIRVAVLGTGTMSSGIAVAFAAAGHPVHLWGRRSEGVESALASVRAAAGFLESEGLVASADAICELVDGADRLDAAVGDAGLVVEAVAEDLDAKREVIAAVEGACPPGTLIATNTSGLRVTDIAAEAESPARIVAMHFWNPAHLMPIVEVAGGERASQVSIQAAVELTRRIGKVPVVLENEVLGFLGTRMQQAVVREALALLQAGVASAGDIDLAARTSFGVRFPVIGPLESTDLSGLDVIASIQSYLLADLDRSTTPQPALVERVDRGEFGVKSGKGFYDWTERDPAEVVARRDAELSRRLRLLAQEGLIK